MDMRRACACVRKVVIVQQAATAKHSSDAENKGWCRNI
jgi:hypothetical protein